MYTSALEMHIEVLQGLQKVAAYTDDMFEPEEIDLHLTKQQNRLVEEIVNKKFQDVEVLLDYIRPLITKNRSLQAFIPVIADIDYEVSSIYSLLPPDYLYLVTDRSLVNTSTTAGICKDLTSYKIITNPTVTDYIEYTAVVPMLVSTATQAPYYYNFTMTLTKSGNPISISIPDNLNNIQSINSSFYITNYVLEQFRFSNNLNLNIYWEYFRNNYYPNSFILVTNDSTITKVDLLTNKSASDTSSGGSSSANFTSITYKVPNYNYTGTNSIPGLVQNYMFNTIVEADELYNQTANVFYRPLKTNPRSTMNNGFLRAYEDKNFLISGLLIDYVRKPKQISLSLNQISELGGNGPSIVVDRTVEYLKAVIENPSYQLMLNDNKVRNQI